MQLKAQIATVGSSEAQTVASCEVVAPLGISKVRDIHFGTIISGNAGSVILSPRDDRREVTGNIALNSNWGTVSAATFEINDGIGDALTTQRFAAGYTITLPTQDVTLVNESGKTMRVGNFTCSIGTYANTRDFVNGKGLINVGATLYVSAQQGTGAYIAATPFPVTVNFN